MEPTTLATTVRALATGKVVADTAMNFEHAGLQTVPVMLLAGYFPHVAPGTRMPAVGGELAAPLREHLGKKGEVAVGPIKDVTESHSSTPGIQQAIEVQTVDARYTKFGNVEDLFNQLSNAQLPSARTIYLALLDILDFIDMGIMGNKLTEIRQSDHLHKHVFKISKTSETHNSAPREEVTSHTKDGKEITHTATHKESTTIESITITDSLDGGTDIIISKASQTVTLHLTEHSICTRAERSWWKKGWDAIVGHDDRYEVKEYSERSGSVKLEQLDTNSGKMVISSYQEIAPQQSEVVTNEYRNWEEGLVTWIPCGSLVNMAGKASAGYKVTTGDWVGAALDVGSTLITFGAGTVVGKMALKGGSKVAGAIMGKAGTKLAASGSKIATGTASAVRPTLGKPVTLSSRKALRQLDNIADNFSEETLTSLANSSSHVPIRTKVWKSVFDCNRYEKKGNDLAEGLHKVFEHEGVRGRYKADQILDLYKQADSYGILTRPNLSRMKNGYCPKVGKDTFDLDHLVPVNHAPELKARIENIRILPASINRARKDVIDADCIAKMKELEQMLDWKPGSTLRQAAQAVN